MTLLDPDAGEILDRLSILARKRLEKPERGHFAEEEAALAEHYGKNKGCIYAERLPALLRLAAVNMALWECENEIRRLRGVYQEYNAAAAKGGADFLRPHYEERVILPVMACAIRLQELNEERSRLIQFFNAELGRGAVEEKDFKL